MIMQSEVSILNITEIVNSNLCIGCGLCSVACPESAITMGWQDRRTWQPEVDDDGCTHCGRCRQVCPHTPQCIGEYAAAAEAQGVRFGLPQDGTYFIAYDKDETRRIRSSSGGVTSALLEHLLASGAVDGVLASLPLEGSVGEPHFQMKIFRSAEDLDRGRSSHYHPLNYDKVLDELRDSDGSFAVVGVPCVLRGVVRLPTELQKKIRYKVCLVCGKNVTGAFIDCLADKEGADRGVPFLANLRDKVGIPDANNYNNLFTLPDRKIRRNRYETAFTDMWRNYFFAQECCLYCPDFYGVDADISVKDAWGRLSGDPLGTSIVIVRNREVEEHLESLGHDKRLFLQKCDSDEVFDSQTATPIFKHEKVRDRLVWKKNIRREMDKNHPSLGWHRRWLSQDSHEYWRLWSLMKLSNFFYFRFGEVPVKILLFLLSPLKRDGVFLKTTCARMKRMVLWPWHAILSPVLNAGARFSGYHRPVRAVQTDRLRVLIAGGYGNGNVGDEAQLAANLQCWEELAPGCQLTVLTPKPDYTQTVHGRVRVELATRISLFGKGPHPYCGSEQIFKWKYFWIAAVCLFNVCLIRTGFPIIGLSTRQARLLDELNNSDVLFLSGGGYLTGMTLTRLWDNMLLIRLAHALGVPTILSGQTVGVFKDRISRALARWGLKKAELIYLRDHVGSPRDLAAIGISPEKISATFDDALFFDAAPDESVRAILEDCGVDLDRPYVAVNAHYWRQQPEDSRIIMKNLARVLDRINDEFGFQVVFVPMHETDEKALAEVSENMQGGSFLPAHGYDPAVTVGIVQHAKLCLTMKHHPIIFAMAARVPTVSLTFDDYYWHKNLGAQKIFGQEDYVLLCKPERLFEQVWTAVSRLQEQYEVQSRCISEKLEMLRPFGGEVIKRWLNTFENE